MKSLFEYGVCLVVLLVCFISKAWDEIEIEDELGATNGEIETSEQTTEQVTNVQAFKSKLSVPLVCSSLIQSILYFLSQEITKNLTYSMIE